MLLSPFLDVSVIAGPLPIGDRGRRRGRGCGLLVGRSRVWWLREVPLVVVTGVVVAAARRSGGGRAAPVPRPSAHPHPGLGRGAGRRGRARVGAAARRLGARRAGRAWRWWRCSGCAR